MWCDLLDICAADEDVDVWLRRGPVASMTVTCCTRRTDTCCATDELPRSSNAAARMASGLRVMSSWAPSGLRLFPSHVHLSV
jgi:hypothetical protein